MGLPARLTSLSFLNCRRYMTLSKAEMLLRPAQHNNDDIDMRFMIIIIIVMISLL